MIAQEWFLKRNCAMAPKQLLLFYALLSALSFSVAFFFTFHGVWLVLVFALIEMAAVGLAFLLYARHATDYEHIALDDDSLLVELVLAQHVQKFMLKPYWARVGKSLSAQGLVVVQAPGVQVELGRFLTEGKRREFARQLERALALAVCRT